MPVLVNWDEKLNSTEKLLESIRNKTLKDEKRLLFYLTEISSNLVEFMTESQIEHELFNHIYPLIGQYMCLVEENSLKKVSYSHLIYQSLLRCLKQCLVKLGKADDLSTITFNCFIDYLQDVLDLHGQQVAESKGSSLSLPQVVSFIKVAHSFTNKDNKNYLLKSSKTTFLVTQLLKLFKSIVLAQNSDYSRKMGVGNELQISENEKKTMSPGDLDLYRNVINQMIELIFTLYSYIENYYKNVKGSAVDSPMLKQVLELLKPMLFSSSDIVKRAMAVKIKSMIEKSFQQTSSTNESKVKDEEMNDVLSTSEINAIKNDIKYLNMIDDKDDDEEMQDEDQEEQLKKAIAMSLEENKGAETSQAIFRLNPDKVLSKEESMRSRNRQNDDMIELVKFFKDQILECANSNCITNADL